MAHWEKMTCIPICGLGFVRISYLDYRYYFQFSPSVVPWKRGVTSSSGSNIMGPFLIQSTNRLLDDRLKDNQIRYTAYTDLNIPKSKVWICSLWHWHYSTIIKFIWKNQNDQTPYNLEFGTFRKFWGFWRLFCTFPWILP